MSVRTIDTPTLIEAAQEAIDIGFNRQIDPEWVKNQVDSKALHFVDFAMPHEHIAGREADLHYRCGIVVGLTDETIHTVYLDMTAERFGAMPTVEIPDRAV